MNAIEEIKARLDIVDIIGQYIPLQKAGRSYKGLCPFHSEKTPSFIVSPERQSWHCFGACGTGGDVFSFIMRKEGLEFGQALRLLAEKANVSLPDRYEAREDSDELERLREANEAAAHFYHNLLLHDQAGKAALDYLERRGINLRWAQEFLLGYSPSGWEGLRSHLRARGFSDAEMLAAGLLVEGESGLYDRFRGRLMFPIRDLKGRIIGFGARALDGSSPKYLNTVQTALFDKGNTLYAIDRAREGIRTEGKAVIVEGYMDAIAAHQYGFSNVVASMGTALTERQVRLLKRYTRNVVLALDADSAGSEAALRGQQVVEEASKSEESTPVVTWRGLVRYQEATAVNLHIAELPRGRDPDEVIRENSQEWRELLDRAKPAMEYKFEAIRSRTDTNDPRARSQAVQELLPVIGAIADPVVRAHYLQRLSRLALLKEEDLAAMLPRARSGREQAAIQRSNIRRDNKEDFFLSLLLYFPELRKLAVQAPLNLLWHSENKQVFEAWQAASDFAELHASLSDELRQHVDRLLAQGEKFPPEWNADGGEAAFRDCWQRLEKRQRELEKQAATALLADQEQELPDKLVTLEAAVRMLEGQELEEGEEAKIKEVASIYIQDTRAGLELHGQRVGEEGREEETEAIYIENVEVSS